MQQGRGFTSYEFWIIVSALSLALWLAADHWVVALAVAALVGCGIAVGLVLRARRRREVEAAFEREWREKIFAPGGFTVALTGFEGVPSAHQVADFLSLVPGFRDQSQTEIDDLVERAMHVAPQPVAERVAQHDAVDLKIALEERGATVAIEDAGSQQFATPDPPPPPVGLEVVGRRESAWPNRQNANST
jgi:hypothetical protein